MESLPNITGNVNPNFLVLITTQPLPEALNMNVRHRSSAFAWRNKRVVLLLFIRKADTAHCLCAFSHVTLMVITDNVFIIWFEDGFSNFVGHLVLLRRLLVALVIIKEIVVNCTWSIIYAIIVVNQP